MSKKKSYSNKSLFASQAKRMDMSLPKFANYVIQNYRNETSSYNPNYKTYRRAIYYKNIVPKRKTKRKTKRSIRRNDKAGMEGSATPQIKIPERLKSDVLAREEFDRANVEAISNQLQHNIMVNHPIMEGVSAPEIQNKLEFPRDEKYPNSSSHVELLSGRSYTTTPLRRPTSDYKQIEARGMNLASAKAVQEAGQSKREVQIKQEERKKPLLRNLQEHSPSTEESTVYEDPMGNLIREELSKKQDLQTGRSKPAQQTGWSKPARLTQPAQPSQQVQLVGETPDVPETVLNLQKHWEPERKRIAAQEQKPQLVGDDDSDSEKLFPKVNVEKINQGK